MNVKIETIGDGRALQRCCRVLPVAVVLGSLAAAPARGQAVPKSPDTSRDSALALAIDELARRLRGEPQTHGSAASV